MESKINIKKGDAVMVIAGDSKGLQGKVLMVDRDVYKAIVEGVNMVSKHSKPNSKNPQGGIMKKESPIHISNLMVVDNSGTPSRIGRKISKKSGKLERYSKNSGEVIK